MKNKRLGPVLLAVLLISIVCGYSDMVTLKVGWQATNGVVTLTASSDILILATNQSAKLLHFYCCNTNAFGPMLAPGDEVWLNSDFAGLSVPYSHSTLFGSIGGGAISTFQGTALSAMPSFVGPAQLKLVPGNVGPVWGFGGVAICTIEVGGTANIQPAGTVEVPPDNGPVDIGLETSTDMEQTWQTATLGRYGAVAEKRFFRLKVAKVGQ